MSTENQPTPEYQASDLDAVLRDPLSLPDDIDLEALANGTMPAAGAKTDEPQAPDTQVELPATANEQGDKDGDAPGTGTEAKQQDEGGPAKEGDEAKGPEPQAEPDKEGQKAVVASKDGKHAIPYEVLQSERERRVRSEQMVQELTSKLEALTNEVETGKASKTRDIADIVDPETLTQLREESPEVAGIIDKLIERNREMADQAQSARDANVEADREKRVQHVVSVEDAIEAHPKLVHIRANDPATFMAIAEIDTTLGKQPGWKDKPLTERFGAAVRMYEAANGDIELPGTPQAQPKKPEPQQLPADVDKRVQAALAKAEAAKAGPSTLSDIPGGAPADATEQDALAALSSAAITERFMNMTPEQVEQELARFV